MRFIAMEVLLSYFLFPLRRPHFITVFDTPSGIRILRLIRVIFIRIDIGFTVDAVDDLDRAKLYPAFAGCFHDLS